MSNYEICLEVDTVATKTELRRALDRFEQRFGIHSANLTEAFRRPDGSLNVSNPEYTNWLGVWERYQRLEG